MVKRFLLMLLFTLSVTPHVGMAPQKVTITIHKSFENDDRWLRTVVWCNGDPVVVSDRDISTKGNPIFILSPTLREPCAYEVISTVTKADGTWVQKKTKFDLRD